MSAPIVVGVDTSRASCDAVFWALSEARRRQSPVLLLHAPDGADAEIASASEFATAARAAAAVVHTHRRHAKRLAPDVETNAIVLDTEAAHALTTASRRAGLLVVGNRGRAGLTESALGSVSQRVAAHAHCPVVVVPAGSARLVIRRVVLGITASGDAAPELDFAAAEAALWAARLVLLPARGADVAAATSRLRERYPQVLVEVGAASDDPVAALVEETHRADLLVLGCRHLDTEFGCRIGAIPAAVLARSLCPVALVGHARHLAPSDERR